MSLAQQQYNVDLVNQLPLGVFVLDREGRFTFLNEFAYRFFQALSGRCRGDLLGQSVWKQCPDFADSAFAKEYKEALASQLRFQLETYFPSLDRWILVLASLAEDEHCFSMQDVSAQKRLESQLRGRVGQLSAAMHSHGEFLLHLANEVRNTVAVLRNNFYLAQQAPEAAAKAATAAEKSVADLTAFLDDLLRLSQSLLGDVPPCQESLLNLSKTVG
jgi:hypothetical protein